MSISLNTNISALSSTYDLSVSRKNLERSLNRISNGTRINNAIDDAGGLAVSLKLSASVRRTDATIANVNNALSFLQTQDGALAVADKLLNRMSELTALAMDITKSTSDLSLYQSELEGLQGQLYGMLDEEFNGIKLFDPGAVAGLAIGNNTPDVTSTMTIVVSASGDQTLGITQSDLEAISYSVGTSSSQVVKMELVDKNNHISSLGYVRFAINALAEMRAHNGAQQARLTASLSVLEENKINAQIASGRITDVDIASESVAFASFKIRHEASAAMLAQANQGNNVLLRLLG